MDIVYNKHCHNIAKSVLANIIPTPRHQNYYEQFDWLEKMFYTSINSMSSNLGTIFLSPAPKMCINVDKNKLLMTKLEL